MGRALLTIRSTQDREKAKRWIDSAPDLSRVEFKGPARSTDQNSLMWELLTQLSEQLPWHGVHLKAEDYKDLLTASLRKEVRTIPNAEGTGFVVLGMRTSDMSRQEMGELLDLTIAFGALHGVHFDVRSDDSAGEQAA